jgi:hypothetical protein
MNKMPYKIIALVCILNAGLSFAEDAAAGDAIVPFSRNFSLSPSGKYTMGIFGHQSTFYRTDKPWDIGLGFRYKNFAIFGYIDSTFQFEGGSFDLSANFYLEKMFIEAFFKRYQKFYGKNNENAGLDVLDHGVMASWVLNNKFHSLRSVYTMSQKQTASSGSFLFGFGVFYSSIYSQNEAMPRFNERQHLLYFGPTAGYSYTFIFKYDIFLNLTLNAGANLGININDQKILFVPQLSPKITVGHHHETWSANLVMGCNASMLGEKDNFNEIIPVTISMTFFKHF